MSWVLHVRCIKVMSRNLIWNSIESAFATTLFLYQYHPWCLSWFILKILNIYCVGYYRQFHCYMTFKIHLAIDFCQSCIPYMALPLPYDKIVHARLLSTERPLLSTFPLCYRHLQREELFWICCRCLHTQKRLKTALTLIALHNIDLNNNVLDMSSRSLRPNDSMIQFRNLNQIIIFLSGKPQPFWK